MVYWSSDIGRLKTACLDRQLTIRWTSTPNLNAFIERFIRSIKEDCLDRVIPLGEAHLRELIGEYMAHYHVERPHQGLGGAFVQPSNDHTANGPLVRRERLGGLLNYYYREAA